MSVKWMKVVLLCLTLSRLCACAQPITTALDPSVTPAQPTTDAPVQVALLLPLHSELFGSAAAAVRSGFLSALEHERGNFIITVVDSGDDVPAIVATYRDLVTRYDIIVGPLSRGAVSLLAQSDDVRKPTIALVQPDLPASASAKRLPSQLLLMGLSIEDEARQIAAWTEREKKPGKVFTLSTNIAWQRRAANAFAQQARQLGMTVDNLELNQSGNGLNASALAQLTQRIQAERPALLFIALDAAQTMQLRNAIGNELPLYGTSQLNPLNQSARLAADKHLPGLNGVYLVDIPWQLQANHPAGMTVSQQAAGPAPNADLERLHALGIDAFRVASQIARQRSSFDLDGVTGQIYVNMTNAATYVQRRETQAVYQDGVAVPLADQH